MSTDNLTVQELGERVIGKLQQLRVASGLDGSYCPPFRIQGVGDPNHATEYVALLLTHADALLQLARVQLTAGGSPVAGNAADESALSATDAEATRWAQRLNWLHTEYGSDSSGVDSGDPLDCVEVEIRQALRKVATPQPAASKEGERELLDACLSLIKRGLPAAFEQSFLDAVSRAKKRAALASKENGNA